jgi:serine O-acetyltransferase
MIATMNSTFASQLFNAQVSIPGIPPKPVVQEYADKLLEILFPHFAAQHFATEKDISNQLYRLETDFTNILRFIEHDLPQESSILAKKFFADLPNVYMALLKDAQAIANEDPAATGIDEVIVTYPGFYAIAIYRLAHSLCQFHIPLIPRILTEYAHQKTGIDIHPGAKIGEYFCIDHGTGIVIGQTTVIGNHVKLYQGVTLGAVSVNKDLANTKRHPTIEDYVVIYAGATILGGNVVIGSNSVIGGNVWLTESVKPYSKVYHKSQIKVSGGKEEFLEYYI